MFGEPATEAGGSAGERDLSSRGVTQKNSYYLRGGQTGGNVAILPDRHHYGLCPLDYISTNFI